MDELHVLQTLAGGLLTSQRQQTLRDVDAEPSLSAWGDAPVGC